MEEEKKQPSEGEILMEDVAVSDAPVESPYKNGLLRGLDNFYGVTQKQSTIRVEILAGIATFLAMCYILVVNPNMIVGEGSSLWGSVFIATALGAIVGTLLMSLIAKMPYAQAPGMGLNSQLGALLGGYAAGAGTYMFSFGTAMLLVLISGLIFLILSVIPGGKDKETGKLKSLREYVFDGIPEAVRTAIPVGIGLFIAYIGFQNAGIIQANSYTVSELVTFNVYTPTISEYAASGAVICFVGLMVIAVLSHFKVKAAVIIGIIVSTIIAIPMGVADVNTLTGNGTVSWAFWESFADFFSMQEGTGTFLASFWNVNFTGAPIMFCIMTVVSFCMIDMFDTMGTITGCAARAGLVDENNKPLALDKCMYADSIATCTGAIFGTSTVTTFVESGAGVAVGGKTGLTSLVTTLLFVLSLFLLPLFAFIPTAAAACALVYVGVLMMTNVKNIDFSGIKNAVPAFLTIIIMPLGYSITDGIGVGLLTYFIIALLEYVAGLVVAGVKGTENPRFDIPVVTIVVSLLFAVYFFVPNTF